MTTIRGTRHSHEQDLSIASTGEHLQIPLDQSEVRELQAILTAEYGREFEEAEAWEIARELVQLAGIALFTSA